MRLAAIDIGSNSVRLVVVDVSDDGRRTTLTEEKAYTRLGRGTARDGRLAEDAMDATVSALTRMLAIAEGLGVTSVRAVATAAVREAANGADFVARVMRDLGLGIDVISGKREAQLALASAAAGFDLGGRVAIVDIGGGSLEIALASDGVLDRVVSLPLGAVVMTERFVAEGPPSVSQYQRLVGAAEDALTGALRTGVDPVRAVIGSGGTITSIGAIIAARRGRDLVSVHGLDVGADEVARLASDLAASSARERAAMKGMAASRVDLMVAGVAVVDAALRTLGAMTLTINSRGMREGIVIDAIEREYGTSAPFDRMRAPREYASAFPLVARHAEHVSRLALDLFDALSEPLGLDPDWRPLLEAAALMHDIGYAVAHEQHNKHSYHMITHAGLPGFSPVERQVIAAIARYHRGPSPKPKHDELRGLGDAERGIVERLAALLRIADGLDRSASQRVRGLAIDLGDEEMTVRVQGTPPFDAEIHGAERKADLFEAVWGRRVRVVQ